MNPHRRLLGAVAGAAILAAALLTAGPASAAGDPAHAPRTTLSNGGRSVSVEGGSPSLSASQTKGLDPAGQVVRVTGSGFTPTHGVYVAFCLVPPTDQTPTPCGGGIDKAGVTGASHWYRSDDYGAQNSADPFGPNGSFDTTINVSPTLPNGIDCRQASCAIVTRSDHKATADRSFDLFLPVTFAAASPSTTATTAPAAPPTVPTTIAALQPTQVAPTATVAADGRSVTDGTRTLQATATKDLDPGSAKVVAEGTGFDVAKGVYVALCAVPAADPSLPAGAAPKPGPCTAGSAGLSSWISSNPPEYGKGLAVAYGSGGSFRAELSLPAVIDDDHDCRQVACALVTRNDDTAAADRTQDLYLPVTFAASSSSTSSTAADVTLADASSDGGSSTVPLVLGAIGAAAILGLGVALVLRGRRSAA